MDQLNPMKCTENVNEATWMTIDMEVSGLSFLALNASAGNRLPSSTVLLSSVQFGTVAKCSSLL